MRLRALAARVFQLQTGDEDLANKQLLNQALAAVRTSLADDLNSPLALEQLDRVANQLSSAHLGKHLYGDLISLCENVDHLLGLKLSEITDLNKQQKILLSRRQEAREKGNFAEADQIRDELAQEKVAVLDTDFGQIWQPL